jgi:hypothetical protein
MNSNRQEHTILNSQKLSTKIYSLLEETGGITVKINSDINEIGKQLLNYKPDDFIIKKEIELEYFTSLPGQKIIVIDNTNSYKSCSFLNWLKYYKFSWYSSFYSFKEEYNNSGTDKRFDLKKLEMSDLNKKPSTRTKIKENAIFLDQYNNPVIFISRPSLNPIILYFKINNIEFSKLSFYFCNRLMNYNLIDEFIKLIFLNVNSFPGSNIVDALKSEPFREELNQTLIKLLEVTRFLNELTILMNVISKHSKVVDVNNKYNNLIKKHRLLEESSEHTIKSLKKIETDYSELDTKYENLLKNNNDALKLTFKFQEYHKNASKENLELKKELVSYKKDLKDLKHFKLCNTWYFMILFVLVCGLFFLDFVLQPNKVEIYDRVSFYVMHKLDELSSYNEL